MLHWSCKIAEVQKTSSPRECSDGFTTEVSDHLIADHHAEQIERELV